MEKKYPIGQLRATIFAQPILNDEKNLNRIKELLKEKDYVYKAPNKILIQRNGQVEQTLSAVWAMVSKEMGTTIFFGPHKIDIIKSKFNVGNDTEEKFCEYAFSILRKIIERFSLTVTRIAYAPVYAINFTEDFSMQDINSRVYAKNKFKCRDVNNILFRQSYRVEENFSERDVLINYVVEASEGLNIVRDERKTTRQPVCNFSLDINTFQGGNYTFTLNEIGGFFKNVISYAEDFVYYFMG